MNNAVQAKAWILFICLLFFFRPTPDFFTHMKTSPLPVKNGKFRPMRGIHDLWAVRVLYMYVPHLLGHGASVYNCHI